MQLLAQDALAQKKTSNCNFVADRYKAGSMYPMVFAFCMADLTTQRTADLTILVKESKR